MRISVGSDYVCTGVGTVTSGGRLCFGMNIYEPGVQFTGTPTRPTCAPQSMPTATPTATGPKTLCCMP
jgi:hypothetical protein